MHQVVELLATWDADVEAADRAGDAPLALSLKPSAPNPEPESMAIREGGLYKSIINVGKMLFLQRGLCALVHF